MNDKKPRALAGVAGAFCFGAAFEAAYTARSAWRRLHLTVRLPKSFRPLHFPARGSGSIFQLNSLATNRAKQVRTTVPNIRGRFFPEVESTGRMKKCLDVLLWVNEWGKLNWADLDEIEILRDYLRSIHPSFCGIRLFVPTAHAGTVETLGKLNVKFVSIEISNATPETSKIIGEKELANAVETGLACDADALVVTNLQWLPYAEELEDLGLFLTDTSFLKYHCEIFVRGHDVPWAFDSKTWGLTWNGFYQMTEQRTLSVGMDFLYEAHKKNLNAEAQETGRSLVHNRLPNICFTRDRLLFYGIQKMAARRAKWRRQEFAFEIGYYLNFYYPLIYGGFDHIALLVNQCLQLGVAEKNVGAAYQGFLDMLKAKSAALHAIFTDPNQVEFIKRIGYLRHYASHRGSLAPGKIFEKPDKELTDDEVDGMIAEAGMDDLVMYLPDGELRESFRQSLRYNFRMQHYEKEGKPVDGVVPIVIDGKPGFILPANDTEWNFQKFLLFMNRVLTELKKCL